MKSRQAPVVLMDIDLLGEPSAEKPNPTPGGVLDLKCHRQCEQWRGYLTFVLEEERVLRVLTRQPLLAIVLN